jgi:hypothetical protein
MTISHKEGTKSWQGQDMYIILDLCTFQLTSYDLAFTLHPSK